MEIIAPLDCLENNYKKEVLHVQHRCIAGGEIFAARLSNSPIQSWGMGGLLYMDIYPIDFISLENPDSYNHLAGVSAPPGQGRVLPLLWEVPSQKLRAHPGDCRYSYLPDPWEIAGCYGCGRGHGRGCGYSVGVATRVDVVASVGVATGPDCSFGEKSKTVPTPGSGLFLFPYLQEEERSGGLPSLLLKENFRCIGSCKACHWLSTYFFPCAPGPASSILTLS